MLPTRALALLSILLPVLLVAACGETPAGDLLREAFGNPFSGRSDGIPGGGREVAVDGPALRLGLGSRDAVATLLEQHGEQRLWRTLDGVTVATSGPRVTAVAGLSEILAGTRLNGPDPLDAPLELEGRQAALSRQVDLEAASRDPDGMRFGVTLECRLHGRKVQEDGETSLLVEENCRSSRFGRFTNRYWADPVTGAVFRSEQWIGNRAPLRIDVLSTAS